MCVIVFSEKGVDAPTEQQIKQMFIHNPDGAGYAYNGKGGEVYYKKGFMTVDELLKELKPLDRWKNKNIAIHFRIGTAGENDKHTCHPFPITTNYGEMRKTNGKGTVLFHNGILADGGMIDENSSDTQDFVAAFAPMLKKYSKSKARDKWMEKVIGASKLLVMYKGEKYKMLGSWQKEGDLWVSNKNWKPQEYATYGQGMFGFNYTGTYEEYWARKEAARLKDAEQLYEALDKAQFMYISDGAIEKMLEAADEYDDFDGTILKDGKHYGYSFEAGCVWNEQAMY